MTSNKFLLGGIVVALVFSAIAVWKVGIVGPQGVPGQDGQSYGAVATLDGVDNPYTAVGGFKEFRKSIGIVATSTVLCSFKNPYNATSSIVAFSMNLATNPFGAISVDLSTSTTAYGTSSIAVGRVSLLATQAQGYVWAPRATSTTNTFGIVDLLTEKDGIAGSVTGTSRYQLAPSEYLTVRTATSTPNASAIGATKPRGSCNVIIRPVLGS